MTFSERPVRRERCCLGSGVDKENGDERQNLLDPAGQRESFQLERGVRTTIATPPRSYCCGAGSDQASEADTLYVMDADGRNLRPFVSYPEYTAHGSPAWSCDGSQLAFDAWRSIHGETYLDAHIFVCNADGTQPRDIGVGTMPSWSPDGNRIVFSKYDPRKCGS